MSCLFITEAADTECAPPSDCWDLSSALSKPSFTEMDLTDTPGQSSSGFSCVGLQTSLQTPQIPTISSGTLAWPPPCAMMSHNGNKIPSLGQSCGEERGALGEIINFTVKGKYRKHICCSIFSQFEDVKGLDLDPA